MTMLNENTRAKFILSQKIKELCDGNLDIVLVNLCTTDGFPVICSSPTDLANQADKIAAMSSTISSLGDSSATQMNQGKCDITIIEATLGNILFVKADYIGKSCVVTVVANHKMALATARYKTKKLAEAINNISE